MVFPARFLESEQMLHGNLKRSIANQNGFNQLLPDTFSMFYLHTWQYLRYCYVDTIVLGMYGNNFKRL